MKSICLIVATMLTLFLMGCSSTPVALAPVGPNPAGAVNGPTTTTGQLEVYSAVQECHDGNEYDTNPAWYQHTDYLVCNLDGEKIRHVFNTVGHYAQRPCRLNLPPGEYLVKAEAKDYLAALIPVVIRPGRTTRVHLDGAWYPGTSPNSELVSAPNGQPVGWRASLAQKKG